MKSAQCNYLLGHTWSKLDSEKLPIVVDDRNGTTLDRGHAGSAGVFVCPSVSITLCRVWSFLSMRLSLSADLIKLFTRRSMLESSFADSRSQRLLPVVKLNDASRVHIVRRHCNTDDVLYIHFTGVASSCPASAQRATRHSQISSPQYRTACPNIIQVFRNTDIACKRHRTLDKRERAVTGLSVTFAEIQRCNLISRMQIRNA